MLPVPANDGHDRTVDFQWNLLSFGFIKLAIPRIPIKLSG